MALLSRREFLAASPAFAAAAGLRVTPAISLPGRIYIGTIGTGFSKGIQVADWNANSGAIGALRLAAEIPSPTFLAVSRRSAATFVYAVSEVDSPNATVTAFSVVPGSGKLLLLNRLETGGSGPTHLSVSPDGRTVVVANYGGGSVTSFRTSADGSLQGAVTHRQFAGSGPYKGRQEAPHTHSAAITSDGRSVLVNDLGLDRIFIFELDPATSAMVPAKTPFWSAKPGSGPRHIAFGPKNNLVYSANELTSRVDILWWSASRRSLSYVGDVSTLPAAFLPNEAFVGEIIASADGRNVYASNRIADDTIAVFRANGTGLESIQFAPSGGVTCRHIALDPTGHWMVVSHQGSKDLTVLARDPATGRLSSPVYRVDAPSPMCVVFA